MSFVAIGAAAGVVGAGTKIYSAFKQGHEANKIHPMFQQYQSSPYAGMQLGLAQQLFNGRMPGSAQLQNNIAGSQANYLNNVNRNAADGSQALALAGLSEGQSDNAYNNLSINEEQYKSGLLQNINQAYGALTDEKWKEYQSMLAKYQMDAGTQTALRGGQFNNLSGAFNDIGNIAIGYGQYNKSLPSTTTNGK